MKLNFVIFSEPRTGSGALTSALDCQKDIFCLKEVFINKNLKSKILNKLNQTSKIENLLGSDHSKWEKIRDEKFKDFLELLASLSNKKIFGYKFFEKHFRSFLNQETYLKFLKETNSKIIILERNNILLQYISQLTAASIGCYSCSIKNKDFKKVFQLNPIKLDYDEYIKYNKKIKRQYDDKLKNVHNYSLEYIHIKYEDFVGEKFIENFKKIFNFLDLDFQDFFDPKDNDIIAYHKKINIYKIKDKIINYHNFVKCAEKNNDIETLNFLEEK